MKKLISIILVFVMVLGLGVVSYAAPPSEYSKYGIRITGENMAVPYEELLAISQKSLKVDPKLKSILGRRQAETILSPQEVFELSFGLFTEADLATYLEEYRNCTLTISQIGGLTQIKSSPVTIYEKSRAGTTTYSRSGTDSYRCIMDGQYSTLKYTVKFEEGTDASGSYVDTVSSSYTNTPVKSSTTQWKAVGIKNSVRALSRKVYSGSAYGTWSYTAYCACDSLDSEITVESDYI